MSEHPATAVARRFIDAVVWGEHFTIWELLSEAGRTRVVAAGERRGLDAVRAGRLRLGTSSSGELDTFLTQVLHGLRVDFSAVELSELSVVPLAHQPDLDRVRVQLVVPAAFGDEPWSAGALELSLDRGGWKIDAVEPVVSRS